MGDNSLLPVSWQTVRLVDVCERIIGGGTPSTTVEDHWNGDIPWITSADIYGLKDVRPKKRITARAIEKSATNILRKGGIIVVTRVGLGKLAIAPFDLCFSQDSQGLELHNTLISDHYALLYLSKAVRIFKYESRGTTISGVTKKQLENLEIPLPPLREQHRIVAKIEELFSELDKGVEALKTAQQQLKVYRQAVLKWAFEGKLTEEWRKSNNYTTKDTIDFESKIESFNRNKEGQDIPRRLAPMDYSDLSGLPFGWLWIEAHKICQSVRDGTHDTPKYVNKGIPLITSKNLVNGTLDFTKIDYISENDHHEIHKRSGVENGDILFGMIGTIGNPVIVDTNIIFSIKNVGLFKRNERLIISKYLNFRTRLSESIYLFFNNKQRYFAMQVATVPRKLAVDP